MGKVTFYSRQEGQAYKIPSMTGTYLQHFDKYMPDTVDEYTLFSDWYYAGKLQLYACYTFLWATSSNGRSTKYFCIFQ